MWLGSQAQALAAGWLFCQGGGYDPVAYPALFAVIGNKYGGTPAAPLLPNFKARFPVGADGSGNNPEFNALGKIGGEKAVTLDIDMVPDHNHGAGSLKAAIGATGSDASVIGYVAASPDPAYPNTGAYTVSGTAAGSDIRVFNHHTPVAGLTNTVYNVSRNGAPHNNLPPYISVDFIIKAV